MDWKQVHEPCNAVHWLRHHSTPAASYEICATKACGLTRLVRPDDTAANTHSFAADTVVAIGAIVATPSPTLVALCGPVAQ